MRESAQPAAAAARATRAGFRGWIRSARCCGLLAGTLALATALATARAEAQHDLPAFAPPTAAQAAAWDGFGTDSHEFALPLKTADAPRVVEAAFTDADEAASEVSRAIVELSSHDADVRRDAAARLAWIGPDAATAVPALLGCLSDRDQIVRAHAARAVWEIAQRQEALATLTRLLDTTHPAARPLAAYFLGHIGPAATAALPALHRAIDATEGLERLHLAEAIARIDAEDERAVSVLIDALHGGDAELRFIAAYALSEVSPRHAERVVPALSAAQRDADDAVRTAATLALQAFRAPGRAVPAVPAVSSVPAAPAVREMLEVPQVPEAPDAPVVFRSASATAVRQPAQPAPGDREPGGTQFTEPHCPRELPITALALNVAPLAVDEEGQPLRFPYNHFIECQDDVPEVVHVMGFSRLWPLTAFPWEPTAFCRRPLYFEEPNLERLGYSHGFCQPFVSAGHFFGTVPLMPYLLHAEPYHRCFYTLGEFRPGSCGPYLCYRPPLSLQGASVQAAIMTALILAIH